VLMNGVSCPAANACTAAGYAHGNRGFQAVAEAWNGSTWAVQPTRARIGGSSPSAR
jgi:hypothetical protein